MRGKLKGLMARFLIFAMLVTLLPVGVYAKTDKDRTKNPTEVSGYLVKYKDSAKRDAAEKQFKKNAKQVKKSLKKSNSLNVKLTQEEAFELATQKSEIELVEPDFEVKTETVDTVPWGLDSIQVSRIQNAGITGQGIKVAVLDTGIASHNDLKIAGGISFVDGESSYNDENGHGTHVAGIIAASANNSGLVGAAPDVELYAVKVLDKNGRGNYSNIIAGIEWAIDNGMQVINMSFGGDNYSQILEEAMNLAYQNNIVLVASAGNAGATAENTMTYPAKYESVIAVAAVDETYRPATFSSVGKGIDIAAPGVAIESTYLNNSYMTSSGTSMAAPHVAGVAALLLSQNNQLKNMDVRAKINNSGLKVDGYTRQQYGNGVIDAELAMGIIGSKQDLDKKPKSNNGNSNNGNGNNGNGNGNSNKTQETAVVPEIDYPFSITPIAADAIKISFRDSFLSADNVEAIVATKSDKNIVFQGDVIDGQEIFDIQSGVTYNLIMKGKKGDTVESYNTVLVIQENRQNKNKVSYAAFVDNVYKNLYDESKLVAPYDRDLTEDEVSQLEALASGTIYEVESNNTYSSADITYDDYDTYGRISSSSDVDWYKVKFSSAGKANFWLGNIPSGCDYDITLYSSNGTTVLASSAKGSNADELISEYSVSANVYYYIKVYSYSGYNTSSYYLFRAKNYPTSSSGDPNEPNNTRATATPIVLDGYISVSTIHTLDDVDYYKFVLPSQSKVTLNLSSIPSGCDYDMALENGSGVVISDSNNGGNSMEQIVENLGAGTYYVRTYSFDGYSNTPYRFTIATMAIGNADSHEPNDTMATATPISANSTVTDSNLHLLTDIDYYKFSFTSTQSVVVDLTNIPSGCDYDVTIYDSSGKGCGASANNSNTPERITRTLDAGTYYIKVYSSTGSSSSYYRLQIAVTSSDDYGNDFATAHNMGTISGTAVTTLAGAIDYAGDVDMFKFIAPKSGAFVIETTSSIDTYGYLYNSAQTQLDYNDDGGDGNNFKISYSLTSGSTYYIKVRHYSTSGTGAYTLTITPPGVTTSIPNNSYPLRWPTDSAEISQWFGKAHEGTSSKYRGIDIQGTSQSNVYSISDGVVATKGSDSYYGNYVIVDFKYSNVYYQVRYMHLYTASTLAVGQSVSKGTIVGKMGATGSTVGGSVLGMEVVQSTNGQICSTDDINVTYINPQNLFAEKAAETDYLTRRLAVTKPMGSTVLSQEDIESQFVWPWEDASNPDIRYRENWDLQMGEVYLRKEVLKMAQKYNSSITSDNLESMGVLGWDGSSASTNFNYRSGYWSPSRGNARIVNNRLVVSYADLWHFMIGNTYNAPGGGTWRANNPPLVVAGNVVRKVYMPKAVAQEHYNTLTDSSNLSIVAENIAWYGVDAAVGYVATQLGCSIPVAGVLVLIVSTGHQVQANQQRSQLLSCIDSCPTNGYVTIEFRMFRAGTNIITDINYGTATVIRDELGVLGNFTAGEFFTP